MTRKSQLHPFHGDPDQEPCAFCGATYETADERHNYGKLINPATGKIRPFVLADFDREAREEGVPTWTEGRARKR